jgi:uncharacterized protein YecT (DUF1311 family)
MKPPVITESFTLLPCNKGSTIGTEGCEEHQLVTADKRIDREVSVLFALLHDDAARSRLVRAETAWFAYRQADSASQADIYEGGSESAVVAVLCATNDDKARSTDLYGFFQGHLFRTDERPVVQTMLNGPFGPSRRSALGGRPADATPRGTTTSRSIAELS